MPSIHTSGSGGIAQARANEKEQTRPDHETSRQPDLQDDLRNLRPEVERYRFPRSHTDHKDQQRQPAPCRRAPGPSTEIERQADAIEGAEHGKENRRC